MIALRDLRVDRNPAQAPNSPAVSGRDMTEVRRGCLVLADISGYTRYLNQVELEHSHDVLADLLGVAAKELQAVGSLSKLEGDAIFVCDEEGTTDGERLLAGIDAAYFAACSRIPALDLKLIAHHGSFVRHVVAGSTEIVGPDVIVVHRLLKNSVPERTGIDAFALLTDACVAALRLDPAALGMSAHEEPYDDIGAVSGWVRDLGAQWDEAQRREPIRIEHGEADFSVSGACQSSPDRVWDALVSPASILSWKVGATAVDMDNPRGARGVGSTTHCVHGAQAFDQEILDWRPFGYFSYRETGPYGPFLWTFELSDNGTAPSTSITVRVKLLGGRRQRLMMTLGRRRFLRILETNLDNLDRLVSGEPEQAEEARPPTVGAQS
jgi:class 3 adenylate cyclase